MDERVGLKAVVQFSVSRILSCRLNALGGRSDASSSGRKGKGQKLDKVSFIRTL